LKESPFERRKGGWMDYMQEGKKDQVRVVVSDDAQLLLHHVQVIMKLRIKDRNQWQEKNNRNK
jgi:hypothetical protein